MLQTITGYNSLVYILTNVTTHVLNQFLGLILEVAIYSEVLFLMALAQTVTPNCAMPFFIDDRISATSKVHHISAWWVVDFVIYIGLHFMIFIVDTYICIYLQIFRETSRCVYLCAPVCVPVDLHLHM